MKRLTGIILFLAMGVVGKAERPDSLLQLLQQTDDSLKSKVYSELVWHYVFNHPDSALQYGKLGLKSAKEHKSNASLAGLYNRMGVAHDIAGNPDSSIVYYEEALKYARIAKVKATEAGALNNLGLIYWNKDDLEKAVEYYLASIKLFEEVDNQQGIGNTYNNLGLIFIDQKLDKKAIEYFRKAVILRKQMEDRYGLSASYLNLSLAYSNLLDPDSVEFYIRKSIQLKKQIDDGYGLAKAYNNLALHFRHGDGPLDSVFHYYQEALRFHRMIGYDYGIASTISNMYPVVGEHVDARLALDSIQVGIKIAEQNEFNELLIQLYWNKALIYSYVNEMDSVIEYTLKSRNMRDSVEARRNIEVISELETKYETEKKEKEILRLDAENAEAALAISRQRNWIIAISLGFLVFAGFGGFVYTQRKRKNEARLAAQELSFRKNLLDATVIAEEKERQRIAKDLHDGLVQSLAALKIGIQVALDKADLNDVQHKAVKEHMLQIDTAANEARNISHQMMPRALEESGLVVAIEDMLAKTLNASHIKYSFEPFGLGEKRLAQSIEIGLYRICQELVNNILKHSGATEVSVQLILTKTHIVLHVEDNGKGFQFDQKNQKTGIGLNNIFSRASSVNGEVNYENGKPKGTIANIRVPLS